MSQEIVATIAGEALTQAEFEAFLKNVPAEQRAYLSNPQARQYYLEQFIAVRLFTKLGEEEKLDETDDFKQIMATIRKDVLSQLAMKSVLSGIEVSDEEIKAYYDTNPNQFVKEGKVSAKHILTDSEEKCTDIFKEIAEGAKSFEDAAKEYSTCPSGQQGGDLGEFGKGQMVKEFEDAAFSGEIGQVIGPVKTQFGYHLIKVEKRTEPETASFDEVKENIRKTLLSQKQNQLYSEKINELKDKYMK
ncbi:MAG: peptidylprolyl isomerase [Clostridiales bacterium]|nr:peptidylprolyl isomerase [Clostridiales bacterium]MDY3746347.1 peptidylprolyl isomerase [Lachnospiraceae bacterium]